MQWELIITLPTVASILGHLLLMEIQGIVLKLTLQKDTVLRDKNQYSFKSSDVSSQNFFKHSPQENYFTELGHCNGMVFVNGFLYVAATTGILLPERKTDYKKLILLLENSRNI